MRRHGSGGHNMVRASTMEFSAMIRNRSAVLVATIPIVATLAPAHADDVADGAAITQRLQRWTAAFNAKDAAGVSDLLAPTSCIRSRRWCGARNRRCVEISPSYWARPTSRLIARIPISTRSVSGDVEVNGTKDTTTEEGINIFRRQPDGRWSIARFVAFTTRANTLLR